MAEEIVKCGECGSPMKLKRSPRFGLFYGCSTWPDCNGTHGAHQKTGKPLGIPADSETKRARILAHREFDKIWKDGGMTRKEAYKWMQEILSIPKKDAHISRLDKNMCEKLILAIQSRQCL